MNLHLSFQNIIDQPDCEIRMADQVLYTGPVLPSFDFEFTTTAGPVDLIIEHRNKRPQDTVVENGKIVRDRSFELVKIVIDHYDLEDLVWQSEFRANDGQIYPSCLFFGPNGEFWLSVSDPILPWILEQRHAKTGDDPGWQEDYQYYQRACNLLKQISRS